MKTSDLSENLQCDTLKVNLTVRLRVWGRSAEVAGESRRRSPLEALTDEKENASEKEVRRMHAWLIRAQKYIIFISPKYVMQIAELLHCKTHKSPDPSSSPALFERGRGHDEFPNMQCSKSVEHWNTRSTNWNDRRTRLIDYEEINFLWTWTFIYSRQMCLSEIEVEDGVVV